MMQSVLLRPTYPHRRQHRDDPGVGPGGGRRQRRGPCANNSWPELVIRGATFVVPVDAEKLAATACRSASTGWCWQAAYENLPDAPRRPEPLVIAVEHHKTRGSNPAGV